MDTKVFLQKVNELKEALLLPNTFRNRFYIKKLRKRIDRMIEDAANKQATSMYR